jgi:hypothetical protein
LILELRYEQGLDDMIARENEEALPEEVSKSVKHRTLRLMAGFVFSLGGG